MTIDEYQKKARTFATDGGKTLAYALLGVVEEVGELVEKTDIEDHLEESERKDLKECESLCDKVGWIAKNYRKNWNYFNGFKRDDVNAINIADKDKFSKEIGDVLWMLANICECTGLKMSDIMLQNIHKLEERLATNTIIGSGDTLEERLANAKK